MMELENKSDLTISKKGQVLLVQGIDVFPFIKDLPGSRPIKRAQDVEESGLPYAGGTHNGSSLPSRKSEIGSLEDLDPFGSISVGLEKVLDLNECFQTIASLAL
jgi:hypothetical protein